MRLLGRRYEWRTTERRLNTIPQVVTTIDGLDAHALHVRSPHPQALPLVLTHGWPGSLLEFEAVLDPLIDPVAYGGQADEAVHLVVPSLPGYGFSGKPSTPGWGIPRIARTWVELMPRLGYDRFIAAGSDGPACPRASRATTPSGCLDCISSRRWSDRRTGISAI